MKNKYELGSELYIISRCGCHVNEIITCPECDGEGFFITRKSKKVIKCDHCLGTGKCSELARVEWAVKGTRDYKLKVNTISIVSNQVAYSEDEYGEGDIDWEYESDLFEKINEANEECDRRNKQ